MDFMNAFFVYAAAHLVLATGGIQMNISDPQSYNKYNPISDKLTRLLDGLLTQEMSIEKKD